MNQILTILRKPFKGTVAANVLKHGTGGIHIKACRLGSGGSTTPSGMDRYNQRLAEQGYRPGTYQKGQPVAPKSKGRWPANLLFRHLDACECIGTTTVKTGTATNSRGWGAGGTIAVKKWVSYDSEGYGGDDGLEEVVEYLCAPRCPVEALNLQSGSPDRASRYFQQFHSDVRVTDTNPLDDD